MRVRWTWSLAVGFLSAILFGGYAPLMGTTVRRLLADALVSGLLVACACFVTIFLVQFHVRRIRKALAAAVTMQPLAPDGGSSAAARECRSDPGPGLCGGR